MRGLFKQAAAAYLAVNLKDANLKNASLEKNARSKTIYK